MEKKQGNLKWIIHFLPRARHSILQYSAYALPKEREREDKKKTKKKKILKKTVRALLFFLSLLLIDSILFENSKTILQQLVLLQGEKGFHKKIPFLSVVKKDKNRKQKTNFSEIV